MSLALRQNVEAWWKTRVPLVAALGGDDALRIHYGYAPQSPKRPYLVWRLTGGDDHQHLAGLGAIENPGLVTEVFAADGLTLEQICDLVDVALRGYRGLMGTRFVRNVFRSSGWTDLPVFRGDGSQAATLSAAASWELWWVPT